MCFAGRAAAGLVAVLITMHVHRCVAPLISVGVKIGVILSINPLMAFLNKTGWRVDGRQCGDAMKGVKEAAKPC
jgi:hypothetical protein